MRRNSVLEDFKVNSLAGKLSKETHENVRSVVGFDVLLLVIFAESRHLVRKTQLVDWNAEFTRVVLQYAYTQPHSQCVSDMLQRLKCTG